MDGGTAAAPGANESANAVLRALSSPRTYGTAQPVQVCETHASRVFLTAEWAYKVKKPVRLAFLDYSTLERRHAACREEIRVNRELGGDIYDGVVAILPADDGARFAPDGTPGAVEYAVRMRRFAESDTLQSAIEHDDLGRDVIARVAARLVRFHTAAMVCDQRDGPASTLATWRENVDELEDVVGGDPRVPRARHFGESFSAAHREEIAHRAEGGMVRDGHGDLRCEHVLLGDPIRVVDRVEFDPALRRIDVGWDLAFLAMDLEAHGQGQAARWLLDEYRGAGGDPGSEQLVCFFAAHWALVRAKVALIAESERTAGSERTEDLLALAEALCWRARAPLALILAGPAASGKSTLAHGLSRTSAWPVLSSDVTRKRLAGIAPDRRARPEHYTDDFSRRTYRMLGLQAAGLLASGMGVLIDATCSRAAERRELLTGIGEEHGRPLILRCEVARQTALERAKARMVEPSHISDATPDIVTSQFDEFEPITEAPTAAVDCEAPLERQLDAAGEAVDQAMPRLAAGP